MTCEERLTMHTPEGACLIINANNETDARQELMEKFKLACNKLAELEDKLENGTMIELPWEVGDIVYILDYEDDIPVDYSGYIFIMANNDFAFLSPSINGEENPVEICNEHFQRFIDNQDNSGIIVPIDEIFTKEEAEARLKELQNNK